MSQGGIFGRTNMAGATPFGRGRFFVPGSYDLELKAFGVKASQDPKTQGNQILIAEFTVIAFEGAKYTSFVDNSTKDTNGTYKMGDTVSTVVDLDNKLYGPRNAKELCAGVKQAYEKQKGGKTGYSLEDAMRDLTNEEADAWVTNPEKNKELLGLVFKMQAWNVSRTNSQTKKPDDFTATKLEGAGE